MSNGTQLIPRETLLSHLQRAEGAEEVSLPIDFFRDLLYQAMPQQRKPLAGVIDVYHIGYHSLQLVFESQHAIQQFVDAHGIEVKT